MNEKTAPKMTVQPLKRTLVEISFIMFGFPAAFSFIANLDDGIKKTPLLERAVLNFEKVSIHAWSVILEKLNIDVYFSHNILSFFSLMALPVGIQLFRNWWLRRSRSSGLESSRGASKSIEVWHSVHGRRLSVVISIGYFLILLKSFDILHLLFDPFTAIYFLLVLVLFYSENWMRVIGLPEHYIAPAVRFNRTALFVMPITLIFFGLSIWKNMKENVYRGTYDEGRLGVYLATNIDGNLLVVILVMLPYLLIGAVSSCRIAFAWVALWAAGIYIVNWISTQLVPYVSRFLGAAGA